MKLITGLLEHLYEFLCSVDYHGVEVQGTDAVHIGTETLMRYTCQRCGKTWLSLA